MRACKAGEEGAIESNIADYKEVGIVMGAITHEHFVEALKGKKPSVTAADLKELERFNQEHQTQK